MPNAVLVIDMLVGFLESGHNLYCGAGSRNIIPSVQTLLENESSKGSELIFICDTHLEDDLEFDMFPVHCLEGSEESQIIPELRKYSGIRINKHRYSGFYGTNLSEHLRELNPEKLIVCGVCTDICVLHTTADARNRDYVVELASDAVVSFDNEAHEWALNHMQKILGVNMFSVADLYR